MNLEERLSSKTKHRHATVRTPRIGRTYFASPSIAFPYIMPGIKLTSSALRRNTFHFLPHEFPQKSRPNYPRYPHSTHFLFQKHSLPPCSPNHPFVVNHETRRFPRSNDLNDHQREGYKRPKEKR